MAISVSDDQVGKVFRMFFEEPRDLGIHPTAREIGYVTARPTESGLRILWILDRCPSCRFNWGISPGGKMRRCPVCKDESPVFLKATIAWPFAYPGVLEVWSDDDLGIFLRGAAWTFLHVGERIQTAMGC